MNPNGADGREQTTTEAVDDGPVASFPISVILVGLDGSEPSRRAAEHAVVIAEMFHAELIGVHAVGLLDVWPDADEPTPRNSHDHVRTLMETDWSAPLRRSSAAWRLELRDGLPVDTMLDAIRDFHADLVVVGTRGSGGSVVGMLGSTSAKIVERSPVPVLVVPSPGDGAGSAVPGDLAPEGARR
ncbi:MAG: universal stress protein [Ilumatobacteraceae bacterium]